MIHIQSPRNLRTFQLLLLALVFLFLLVRSLDFLFGTSSDFAHHYALTARILELWQLPEQLDPSLGEMNVYPPGSHVLAAIIGFVLHSPLLGMHVLSFVAVMVIWGVLFYLLLMLPRKNAIASGLLLMLLLVLNALYGKFELHGREIAGDYFFAQLVAQAMALLVLASLLLLERNGKNYVLRYLFCLGFIYLCVSVHLLAALEMLAFFCISALLDLWLLRHASKSGLLKRALLTALLLLLTLKLVLSHPSYMAMRTISQSNGLLHLNHLIGMREIAAYCGLIMLLSASLLRHWLQQGRQHTEWLLCKYIGSYGLALAALCLVQITLLHFGKGSEYAVKKYMFGLHSVFAMQLVIALGLLAKRFLPKLFVDNYPTRRWQHLLLPAVGVLVAFPAIFYGVRHEDMSDIARRERQIMARLDLQLRPQSTHHNYVAEVSDIAGMVNYMFSIGLLHAPRTDNAMQIFRQQPMRELDQINTVITSENSALDKRYACRTGQSGAGLVMLDGRCMARLKKGMGGKLDLSDKNSLADCTHSGLSEAEPFGRWTSSQQVKLACLLPVVNGHPAKSLTLHAHGFLDKQEQQLVQLSITGGATQQAIFNKAKPDQAISLSLEQVQGDKFELVLNLPNAKSPKELGISGDTRQLGISISVLEFK